MSGQQPPYGQPPQQPGPPQGLPYGRPPGQQPPRPPYGQAPQGPPPGPPPGWQNPPGDQSPPPAKRRRSGLTVLVAALAALVIVFAALSAYLWMTRSSGTDASTAEVSLPDEVGDYTAQEPSDDEYAIDMDQTREDYEDVLGAGFDQLSYALESSGSGDGSSDDETPTITVTAYRAEIPLTPGYTTGTSSTETVRDDLSCNLAYYEGYDPNAKDGEDDDKEQLPQSCSRSDDGLTVIVSTYATSVDKDPLSVDEMSDLTDEAYDAVK